MNQLFVNGLPVINNNADTQRFAVNLNSYETLTQSLYDSAAYPTTGISQLTFFQYPIGAGISVISAGPKTGEDTNMQGSGALPNMQGYVVTSVELDIQPDIPFTAASMPAAFGAQAIATSINDVWRVRSTGYLNFNIGSKSYLFEGPLMKFPASNDFEINAAVSDATTPAAAFQTRIAYGKAVGPAYILSPNNLLLIPMQNFNVSLNWATLQPVATTMRIFARFMGQLLRASQ
jgi:hypothetical protein